MIGCPRHPDKYFGSQKQSHALDSTILQHQLSLFQVQVEYRHLPWQQLELQYLHKLRQPCREVPETAFYGNRP